MRFGWIVAAIGAVVAGAMRRRSRQIAEAIRAAS
jgi:hypothetical protein